MRPAVFLDRDGTLIELVHHLVDPTEVKLIDGAGPAVQTMQAAGYACVVVTNQSVVGRGLLTEAGLGRIHDAMYHQLSAWSVRLDGVYFCPEAPRQNYPTVIEHPDRKPGPGMLLKAAEELDLDLGRSWMIGDAISDMLAARHAGCRGILVRTGLGRHVDDCRDVCEFTVADISAASELILQIENSGCPEPDGPRPSERSVTR